MHLFHSNGTCSSSVESLYKSERLGHGSPTNDNETFMQDRETVSPIHIKQCINHLKSNQIISDHKELKDRFQTDEVDAALKSPISYKTRNGIQTVHISTDREELSCQRAWRGVESTTTTDIHAATSTTDVCIQRRKPSEICVSAVSTFEPAADTDFEPIRNVACQTSMKMAHVAVQTVTASTVHSTQAIADSTVTVEDSKTHVTMAGQPCTTAEDRTDKDPSNQIYSAVNSRCTYCCQGGPHQDMGSSNEVENINSCPDYLADVSVTYLDKDDLKIMKDDCGSEIEVGRGRFGQVVLGNIKGKTESVAVKHILKASSPQAKLVEAKILKCLENTDVVPKLYGVLHDVQSEILTIVQEYFGEGFTLFDLLSSPGKLPDMLLWMSLAYQLVHGLQVIHEKDVLINDIKINNVLIHMQKLRVKYIDFGLATVGNGRKYKRELPADGKFTYLAPEVRKGNMSSEKSDIYSLCYMLHQISMVIKVPRLFAIAHRGAAFKPADRPSLQQVKSNVCRLLFDS